MPGGVLIWLGAAALVTGVASLLISNIFWPLQFVIFGVLGLIAIWLWLQACAAAGQESDRPFLNQRANRFIGRELVLAEPIEHGAGRVSDSTTPPGASRARPRRRLPHPHRRSGRRGAEGRGSVSAA